MRNNKQLAGASRLTAFLALAACSTHKGPCHRGGHCRRSGASDCPGRGVRLPAHLQGVEASVSALKAQLASKDYKSVLDRWRS